MLNKPEVSIIIPAYNSEKFIAKTINSVLMQTFTNYEILVINDGSKDNTEKVVMKLSSENSKIRLINQVNSGVSAARNKGIKESIGNYICFLDSDDFYEKTFLEEMIGEIKNKNKMVCYCGYNKVSPNRKEKVATKFQSEKTLEKYILGSIRAHTTSWMINKNFLIEKSLFFNESVTWGEDFEFFCRVLALTNEVSYVDKHLSNYTVEFNENRLSSYTINKIDDDYITINNLLTIISENQTKSVENALIDYRLPALITYRLLNGIKYKVNKDEILSYFNKYKRNIIRIKFNNGLRSIKLNLSIIRLILNINKLKE